MSSNLNNRMAEVDFIRGLAVLSVVSVHTFQVFDLNSDIFLLGQYGVELFFIISGFLMSTIYSLDFSFSVKTFVRRRASRLLPLWLVFLFLGLLIAYIDFDFKFLPFKIEKTESLLIVPVVVILGSTFNLWLTDRLWNSIIPGGWSIQCEVYNYLIFALTRRFQLWKILLFAIFLNLFTVVLGGANQHDQSIETFYGSFVSTWFRFGVYSSFSYFMFGVMVQKLRFTIKNNAVNERYQEITDWLLTLILLISLILTPLQFGNQIQCIIYCILSAIIAKFLIQYTFIAHPITSMGKYSYSIYFVHFYFLSLLDSFGLSEIGGSKQTIIIVISTFVVVCFISWCWALFTWKFIESPIIHFFR